jgi:MoaA/NifB/PqqE/SkfB family radical SAM enzyme
MCHTWRYPTKEHDEIGPEIMQKIPGGQRRINLTGGEPALRTDLLDIVHVLKGKTPRLEISTNGYFTKQLVDIGKRFPQVTFRISLEGLPKLNDQVRGMKNGFDHSLKTVLSLLDAGVQDVGFGMVVSDKNASDLHYLYNLCSRMGIEFATTTMHNSFYFHKHDNMIENTAFVEQPMKEFISALLQSHRGDLRLRLKDWGRAFINRGIVGHMLGDSRPLPCGAGNDLFFLDPAGQILACNGSREPWIMGNLRENSFNEIWSSEAAKEVRMKVRHCKRDCWMVGTAVPAMRRAPWIPLLWILKNKIRLALKQEIQLSCN